MDQVLSFESIRAFIEHREVDLVLGTPPPPFVLNLRGQFDGYGDFFSILAVDVEYLDLPGSFTLGEMLMVPDVGRALSMAPKWAALQGVVSGSALLMRTADSESWQDAKAQELAMLVANQIVFRSGVDWARLQSSPGRR